MNSNILLIHRSDLQELMEESLQKVLAKVQAPPQTEEKPYLTIDEACEVLSISKSSIYSYTSNDRIPYYKTGKKLYFKRSELLIWIECNGKMRETRRRINQLKIA